MRRLRGRQVATAPCAASSCFHSNHRCICDDEYNAFFVNLFETTTNRLKIRKNWSLSDRGRPKMLLEHECDRSAQARVAGRVRRNDTSPSAGKRAALNRRIDDRSDL